MNFKLILLATLLMACAVVYGSPLASSESVESAESRSVESAESLERSADEETDQTFYDPLSTCTADADCAARLLYKYCISTILGKKCGLSFGRK